jgi:hypothetical protein
MPPATEYKYSVALSRYASAEAARYRYVGHEFVHPFGGESVAPYVQLTQKMHTSSGSDAPEIRVEEIE